MEDLTNQIARLSQELKALETQLQWSSFQCCSPGDQEQLMDRLLNAGLGQNLKRTVDLLNHFLWCYIESVAAGSNAEVDYAQQSSRLAQITDVLRLLHHSSCPLRDSLAAVEHAAMTVTEHASQSRPPESLAWEKSA
ncbi:MAG TPA: hypothetical protein VJW20_18890 [Candidatus Angelobacter sp.]|nr:hypothetical protein [Candidatus Angelobacter sp.]